MATFGYFWLLLATFGYFRLLARLLAAQSLDGSFQIEEAATWRGFWESSTLTVHFPQTLPEAEDVQARPGQDYWLYHQKV